MRKDIYCDHIWYTPSIGEVGSGHTLALNVSDDIVAHKHVILSVVNMDFDQYEQASD
jgi:hypothetical protein